MELKLSNSAPLEVPFPMVSFFPEVKISVSGRKPWTIVRRFDQNRGHSLRPFYSKVEGAMKLHHSAPLEICFCRHGILFSQSDRFWPKTIDYVYLELSDHKIAINARSLYPVESRYEDSI